MNFMTHFHSKNVYFYAHYNDSLKVTALVMSNMASNFKARGTNL